MARPNKIGLSYFPFDIDFFEDEKILAVSGEFGIKGEITTIKLLCAIYKNGYFILWNDLMKYKMLRNLPGISSELIDSIVKRLVSWGFFDISLFDSTKVLTSKAIQERYFSACKRRKVSEDYQYLLINVCNNIVNVDNNSINVCNNTQRKEKINKEISTDVDIKKPPSSSPPYSGSISSDIEEMKNSQLWLEQMQMRYHIKSTTDLIRWLDEFKLDCECRSTIHRDISDAKKHFCDWLRIQIEKSKSNGNSKNNFTSKQEANDYAMRQFAEECERLDSGISDGIPKPF